MALHFLVLIKTNTSFLFTNLGQNKKGIMPCATISATKPNQSEVFMMSQIDSILDMFEITDPHLHVLDQFKVSDRSGIRARTVHIIEAKLTHDLKRCPLCGQNALIKYGTHLVKARLMSLTGGEYQLRVHKQRFRCRSCRHTCDAHSPELLVNHTMTHGVFRRIRQMAHDNYTAKQIGELLCISANTVARCLFDRPVCFD